MILGKQVHDGERFAAPTWVIRYFAYSRAFYEINYQKKGSQHTTTEDFLSFVLEDFDPPRLVETKGEQ